MVVQFYACISAMHIFSTWSIQRSVALVASYSICRAGQSVRRYRRPSSVLYSSLDLERVGSMVSKIILYDSS